MNSLDSLIREHINYISSQKISNDKIFLIIGVVLFFVSIFLFFLGNYLKDEAMLIIATIVFVFSPFIVLGLWYTINFNIKDVNMKQEYNITLEEKDKTIELLYNENKESSKYIKRKYIKDKFKIVFSKDKENHYYIYFDDKIKDKKSIAIEEIQQFFKDNVDYSYYESLEKFRLEDLTQKDNKSSKEANIEQLEKKLNELKEKKKVSKKEIKKSNVEQLQKELDELQKKIDKEKENE